MKKLNLTGKNYSLIFIFASVISILIKDIILCGYFVSFKNFYNGYATDFFGGLVDFAPYLIFNLAVAMIVFSISFLFNVKPRCWIIIVLNFVMSAFMFLDSLSMRSFFDAPTISLLFLNSAGSSADEAASLISFSDFFYFFDFLIFIPLQIYFCVKTKGEKFETPKRKRFRNFILTILISAFCLVAIPLSSLIGIDFLNLDKKIYHVSNLDIERNFSSFGFHMMDIWQLVFGNPGETPSKAEKEMVKDYINWKNEDLENEEHFGIFKDKNFIVIQVESLENFVIDKKIENQEITPKINSLLDNSIRFTNINEQVRMGNSSDCDLMFLTSIAPIDSGSTFLLYADRKYDNSFPNLLNRDGYESYYLHGASNAVWNYSGVMQSKMGFKNMKMDYHKNRMLNGYIDDAEMLDQTFDEMKEITSKDEKYYAHITLCTSHMPFYLPEDEKKLNLPKKLNNNKMGKYLQIINYVDNLIGEFIDNLDKEGMLDNTTILIMGDHNGIHKYYANEVQKLQKDYSDDWTDTKLDSVAFILYDKDLKKSEVFDTLGGQIDIMPTLLYSLGIDDDKYKDTSLGRNLFNTKREYFCSLDGQVEGNLSGKDKEMASKVFLVSDFIIRANLLEK
jgi:phosphoglycerol transferase MdoB-like AlkP superfamily enzyme